MRRKLSTDERTHLLAEAGKLVACVADDLDSSGYACRACGVHIEHRPQEAKLKDRLAAVVLKLSDIAEKLSLINNGANGPKENARENPTGR